MILQGCWCILNIRLLLPLYIIMFLSNGERAWLTSGRKSLEKTSFLRNVTSVKSQDLLHLVLGSWKLKHSFLELFYNQLQTDIEQFQLIWRIRNPQKKSCLDLTRIFVFLNLLNHEKPTIVLKSPIQTQQAKSFSLPSPNSFLCAAMFLLTLALIHRAHLYSFT